MSRKDEILSVKALGECIGYGNMMDIAIRALEKQKAMECLLEKAADEIENIYGRETELSEEIRDLLDCLN